MSPMLLPLALAVLDRRRCVLAYPAHLWVKVGLAGGAFVTAVATVLRL